MNRLSYILIALLISLAASGCKGGAKAGTDEHGHEAGHEEAGHDESTHKEEAGHAEGEHTEDIVLTPEAAKIAGIEIGEARMMPMQGELSVPATISATAQGKAVVTPPSAGQITRILVKVGQTVRAGQPIATLQSGDLAEASARVIDAERDVFDRRAAVKEAQSQVDLANAKLRTAQQVLTRQQAFAKTGAFSQPALQAAQKEVADAEAELERGKQDQLVHEAQLERAERLYTQELISRTELEQARLEVATDKIRQRNAERRIELAKSAYEREKSISERGLLNSREIQAAEGDVRAANLEVQQAKIKLASARESVQGAQKGIQAAQTGYRAQAGTGRAAGGSLTVSAPISGIVTDFEATIGQAVERTTELCEIENLKSVLVIASVPEKQLSQAMMGGSALITVNAFPRRSFKGVIQVVGRRLDPKTRSMPVHILVENVDGALRAGMFARASLGVGASTSALAVPQEAIVEDGDVRKLYIAEEGGKYEEKVVVLGRTQGDFVEVVSGLEPGAKIVVKGAFVLKSEKVKSELKGHEH